MCKAPRFSSHTMKIAASPTYSLISKCEGGLVSRRKEPREKAVKKKKKRTGGGGEPNVNFSPFAQVWLFMSIFLKFCVDLSLSPGCQNGGEESCWLTHETHYQKLSILIVKATEAICTLLRSLLHFDNCFSPWTVEF